MSFGIKVMHEILEMIKKLWGSGTLTFIFLEKYTFWIKKGRNNFGIGFI